MATKYIRTKTDDLTGEPSDNVTTVRFSLDGETTYSLELNPTNLARFKQTMGGVERRLAKYVEAGNTRTAQAAATAKVKALNRNIREWARENGIEVGDRGAISKDIKDAYFAAN